MTGPGDSVGVELSVIPTAHISMPYGYVFRARGNGISRLRAGLRAGDDALDSPCLAYVVRHPSAGPILIDTGLHADARRDLRRDFGLPMGLLFRGIRPAVKPFDVQLRELEVEPESVQSALMTHLHVDHTSGMRLLPNARFTCARAEWEAARGRFAAGRGYVRRHLPTRERMNLVDFATGGEAFGPFEKTVDFLGDGSIRLLYTPGHTPGHLSVLLRLEGGRQVLVVGDAAYTLRSIDEGILPMITVDDEASVRSLRALAAFADQEPGAVLVPSHDPHAWHALRDIGDGEGRENPGNLGLPAL
jgi:N-acyl homoserine lactone hydrolase